jgi:hypothetical protein
VNDTSSGDEPAPPAERVARPAARPAVQRIARRPALGYHLDPEREHFVLRALTALSPGIGVLRRYRRTWARPDVFAGVAVAAYLVPQVMAYTTIINVPPITGLWTALAALIVYAVMDHGCCRWARNRRSR